MTARHGRCGDGGAPKKDEDKKKKEKKEEDKESNDNDNDQDKDKNQNQDQDKEKDDGKDDKKDDKPAADSGKGGRRRKPNSDIGDDSEGAGVDSNDATWNPGQIDADKRPETLAQVDHEEFGKLVEVDSISGLY